MEKRSQGPNCYFSKIGQGPFCYPSHLLPVEDGRQGSSMPAAHALTLRGEGKPCLLSRRCPLSLCPLSPLALSLSGIVFPTPETLARGARRRFARGEARRTSSLAPSSPPCRTRRPCARNRAQNPCIAVAAPFPFSNPDVHPRRFRPP